MQDQRATAIRTQLPQQVGGALQQELRDLEVKLASKSKDEMLDLVRLVFRSPVYTQSITGSMPGHDVTNGNSSAVNLITSQGQS